MSSIQERVEAGAAWLDTNRPGWVDRINLETLQLRSTCNCVLGQEFGHFFSAPDEVTNGNAGAEHGFDRYSGITTGASAIQQYEDLTAAWRDYITARRAAVLPHGMPHCTCPIPCETCGATELSGYQSGCEECSERRNCAFQRAEFGGTQ